MRDERELVARDLHDALGHSMAEISLHAAVAEEAAGSDSEAVRSALRRVREASDRAFAEVRSSVGLLRSGRDGEGAVVTLAGAPDLLAAARVAGLDAGFEMAVRPAEVGAAASAAAYRIVQESVTNVVRHARASTVHVLVRVDGDEIVVRIVDDGCGAGAAAGSGVTGMAERARLLGGSLHWGAGPGGGQVVEARLPRGGPT